MSSSQHDFCFILASLFFTAPSSPPPACACLSSSQLDSLAHTQPRKEGGEVQVARFSSVFSFLFLSNLLIFYFSIFFLDKKQNHIGSSKSRISRSAAWSNIQGLSQNGYFSIKIMFCFVSWFQKHCVCWKVLQILGFWFSGQWFSFFSGFSSLKMYLRMTSYNLLFVIESLTLACSVIFRWCVLCEYCRIKFGDVEKKLQRHVHIFYIAALRLPVNYRGRQAWTPRPPSYLLVYFKEAGVPLARLSTSGILGNVVLWDCRSWELYLSMGI